MAVFKGSRYEGQKVFAITGRDGVTRKLVEFRDPVNIQDVDPDWVQHTKQFGDELDSLAYSYGGGVPEKSKLWWLVSDVNDVIFPLEVENGAKLAIPLKELRIRSV